VAVSTWGAITSVRASPLRFTCLLTYIVCLGLGTVAVTYRLSLGLEILVVFIYRFQLEQQRRLITT